MTDTSLVAEKIAEVKNEMKRMGLWCTNTPAWVMHYAKRSVTSEDSFCEWLQFIYLPNRKTEMTRSKETYAGNYIAPQATTFFGEDLKKGKLLQLLIELDSL